MAQIGGIISGFDTQSFVKEMMRIEQTKIDREFRIKTKSEWRIEGYSDFSSSVRNFRNKYFSAASKDSLMLSGAYNSYNVSMADNPYVKIGTAGPVSARNMQIYGIKTANSASVSSKELKSNKAFQSGSKNYLETIAEGKDVSGVVTNPNTAIGSAGKFTINGKEVEYGATETYQDLMNKVNAITGTGGNQLYEMNFANGKFSIESKQLGSAGHIDLKNISGTALGDNGFLGLNDKTYTTNDTPIATAKVTGGVTGFNSKDDTLTAAIEFNINGVNFKFDAGSTVNDILTKVNQSKAGAKISFNDVDKKFTIENTSKVADAKLTVSGADAGVLGMNGGTYSAPPREVNSQTRLSDLGITNGTKFKINDVEFTIGPNTTIAQLIADVKSSAAGAEMNFDETTGKFSVVGKTSGAALKLENGSGSNIFGDDSLTGIKAGTYTPTDSDRLNTNMSLADYARLMGKTITDGSVEFTLQTNTGTKTYKFDSSASVSSVMSTLNGSGLNAQFSYSQINDNFSITDKTTGARSTMNVSGSGFELFDMAGAGSGATTVTGRDATVSLKVDNGPLKTISSSTNTFTRDGITFNLTSDFNVDASGNFIPEADSAAKAPITSNFSYNSDDVVQRIKNFIAEYNQLITKLSGPLSEKSYKDYQPLTDEEREALKDTEVENWDKKAKSGLFRNDMHLNSVVSKLRSAIYQTIGETGMSAASLGITTRTRSDTGEILNGQLELTESGEKKLREMLETNPEAVQGVLAGSGGAKGTFGLLSDAMNDFSKTVEKNTIEPELKNLDDLEKKIKKMSKDMLVKEQNLWAQFTRMEKQMASMQSSQNFFASMLGG